MKLLKNLALRDMTTMRLGGVAKYVAEVFTEEDVKEAYTFAKENNLKTFVVGGGSNLIGRDEGFNGLVIHNKITEPLGEKDGVFTVPSGIIMDDFIQKAVEKGWSGMEAMAGIPGTIGAAPIQNAGAYGQEIGDALQVVRVYDVYTAELRELSREECSFAYRKSIFNTSEAGKYFIVSVTVKLAQTNLEPPFYNSLQNYLDTNNIKDYSPKSIYDAVSAVRAAKLPDVNKKPSAGSFFKNVILSDDEADEARKKGITVWENSDGARNVVPSGWLIENTGLGGKELYGFKVSEKAALILINKSAESYADLEKAKAEIVEKVREKWGITLEQEPVEIA